MTTVVVPFRGVDSKSRLEPVSGRMRGVLARAMLADVLAAATAVGHTVVATREESLELPESVERFADEGRGQGAAVRSALDALPGAGVGTLLVVNADLPCATPRDLLALAGATPPAGLALVAAADGTTNALALANAALFAPVYGPGSAERFAALAPSRRVDAPNLIDDVDTLDDLARLERRLGPCTREALRALRLGAAA